MIPRRPNLDFRSIPIRWAKNEEFSVDLNAGSPIASQSEPYLNTVMGKMRASLPADRLELRRDIEVFIKQETNHYKVHNDFNRHLYESGYEKIRAIEMELRDDFRRLLKEKSLTFNAAYCAGFENLALFLCKYIFFKAQSYFEGGHPVMVDLFMWHYAEEFEHRTVAHDAYAAMYGNYFHRVHGAIYSFFHLAGYKSRIRKAILEIDRATMTAEEAEASRRRITELDRKLSLYVLPRMLAVLIPYYNPRRTKLPRIVQEALDKYASGEVPDNAAIASS